MAVSQLNVEYADGMRDGGRRSAAAAAGERSQRVDYAAPESVNAPERALEPEIEREILDASANASPADTEQLLQRVRAMIDQSEQRQQRELALRLSQVSREVDTQHQADLLRIQQDFGQQQEAHGLPCEDVRGSEVNGVMPGLTRRPRLSGRVCGRRADARAAGGRDDHRRRYRRASRSPRSKGRSKTRCAWARMMLNKRLQASNTDNMVMLAGLTRARGFRLDDYGVVFDVEFPVDAAQHGVEHAGARERECRQSRAHRRRGADRPAA